jgi:hypothetical protein
MAKKPKGPKGAAAYKAEVEGRGLSTVMDDVKKKVKQRTKRTSGKVKSVVSTARSY